MTIKLANDTAKRDFLTDPEPEEKPIPKEDLNYKSKEIFICLN